MVLPAILIRGLGVVRVCGRMRLPMPAMGMMIFMVLFLVGSSMSESSARTRGLIDRLRLYKLYLLVPRHHHLTDALTGCDLYLLIGKVDYDDADLPTIVRIYGSRGVQHGDALLQ